MRRTAVRPAHAWASDVEVRDGGRLLVGGSPTRVLRLAEAGARVVGRWRTSTPEAASPAEGRLLDRLVGAGMVDPVGGSAAVPVTGWVAAPVAVDAVVPVRDRDPVRLRRCVEALARSGVARVVVVDDGSAIPVDASRLRPERERPEVEVIRLERSVGPGAARTAGVAAAGTELVALVDSDVDVSPGWLAVLCPLFDDPDVALVAPRVAAAGGSGLLGRHEAVASPLDLGARRGAVGPGRRLAYVPAAALVLRRPAFDAAGGFDPALRVGEDVDLVWRLVEGGRVCRYEPEALVRHDVRSDWSGLLRQRFSYGTSAAVLDERHPGRVPPAVCSPWSLAVVGLAAAGHPVVALGAAAATGVRLARRLDLGPGGRGVAWRLVGRGHLGAARQLARVLVRPWWPATLVVGAVVPRLRRRLAVAVTVSVVVESSARRRSAPGPYRPGVLGGAVAWLADEAAYGAGVWWGCVRRRRWRPLVPAVPHGGAAP